MHWHDVVEILRITLHNHLAKWFQPTNFLFVTVRSTPAHSFHFLWHTHSRRVWGSFWGRNNQNHTRPGQLRGAAEDDGGKCIILIVCVFECYHLSCCFFLARRKCHPKGIQTSEVHRVYRNRQARSANYCHLCVQFAGKERPQHEYLYWVSHRRCLNWHIYVFCHHFYLFTWE